MDMEETKSTGNRSILITVSVICIPLFNQVNTGLLTIGTLIYLPLIVIFIWTLAIRKNIVLTKQSMLILGLYLIITVALPFLNLNVFRAGFSETVMAVVLNTISFLVIFLVANDNHSLNAEQIIACLLIGNSIIFLLKIIENVGDLSLLNLAYLINGTRKSRAYLGFSHPNWVAFYACLECILAYIYLIRIRKNKVIGIAIISVSLLAIISSGSRSGFYCIAFFCGMEIYHNLLMKRIQSKIKYLVYLIPVFLILSMLIDTDTSEDMVSYTSGRNILNATAMSNLIKNGYAVFGYAPLNFSNLSEYVELTDCGYIITIGQYGYIGLIGFIIIFLYIAYCLIKEEAYIGLDILFVLLLYSATENVVFNPGVSLSICLWILIALFLVRNEEIETLIEGNN